MIKFKIEEKLIKKPSQQYPYVGHIDAIYYVLFFKPKTGTVIMNIGSSGTFPVGFTDNDWNEERFQKFYGTITMECNEERGAE